MDGMRDSTTSTGLLRAVEPPRMIIADSPSNVGRPPVPPALRSPWMKSLPVSGCVPNAIVGIWSPYAPAGIRSFIAGASALQPELDQQVDRHVVARGRRRLLDGEHRALRDDHRQRPEAALVDRILRRRQALDEQAARADRDRVAAVERPDHLRVGAGEVDRHRAVADRDRHLHAHRRVERDAVVVEVADGRVDAGRNCRERGPRAALGLLQVDARRVEHGLATVLREDLLEVRLAGAAHRDHRLHVLERAALDADVRADDAHHLFVQLAAARKPHRLEAQPFLTELARARSACCSAPGRRRRSSAPSPPRSP